MNRHLNQRRGLLGLSLVVSILALTACGNAVSATEAGRLGVMVDDSGQAIAVVRSCSTATPAVDLSEGRPADDDGRTPNVTRGSWTAKEAYAGVQEFAISPSPAGWTLTGTAPGELEADKLFILSGGTDASDDAYLQQVTFRTSDLAALKSLQIRTGDGAVEDPATFAAYACR